MAKFDPILISYQIVCLQCFFYLSMAVFLSLLYAIFDFKISLDHFFTPRFINFISMIGWIETACFIASAIAGQVSLSVTIPQLLKNNINKFFRAYLLSIIVEKSKKCVDFTFTLYFIHVIICTFYYQVCLLLSYSPTTFYNLIK